MMRHNNLTALYAIVESELARFLRVWGQTLFPPAISMTLYFVVFGKFIGAHIADINGVSYMQFIVPGLIMMSLVMAAYNNTVFSFFISKFHKSLEEMLVAPVPNVIILLGFMCGGIARGLLVGSIVTVISLLFTHFSPAHPGVVLLSAVLASTLFSLAGFTNAVFAKKFDDVSIVPTFVLQPLTYLGGVFYSLSQLSPVWRDVSRLNPVMYIVEAFRFGFLGSSEVNVAASLIVLAAFVLLLFWFNLRILKKGTGFKV